MKNLSIKEINLLSQVIFDNIKEDIEKYNQIIVEKAMKSTEGEELLADLAKLDSVKSEIDTLNLKLNDLKQDFNLKYKMWWYSSHEHKSYFSHYFSKDIILNSKIKKDIENMITIKNIFKEEKDNFIEDIVKEIKKKYSLVEEDN